MSAPLEARYKAPWPGKILNKQQGGDRRQTHSNKCNKMEHYQPHWQSNLGLWRSCGMNISLELVDASQPKTGTGTNVVTGRMALSRNITEERWFGGLLRSWFEEVIVETLLSTRLGVPTDGDVQWHRSSTSSLPTIRMAREGIPTWLISLTGSAMEEGVNTLMCRVNKRCGAFADKILRRILTTGHVFSLCFYGEL